MKKFAFALVLAALSASVLAQEKPPTPAPTIDSLQAQVLTLRQELQDARAELAATKVQRDTWSALYAGCQTTVQQMVQGKYQGEINALQQAQSAIDADKAAVKAPSKR